MPLFPDSQGLGENLFQPGTTLGRGGGGSCRAKAWGFCSHVSIRQRKRKGRAQEMTLWGAWGGPWMG